MRVPKFSTEIFQWGPRNCVADGAEKWTKIADQRPVRADQNPVRTDLVQKVHADGKTDADGRKNRVPPRVPSADRSTGTGGLVHW